MSDTYDHFQIGTHPVTGQPWAYCLACPSGNGPTIEALRAACHRICQMKFYDQYGHVLTRPELVIQAQEQREDSGEQAETSRPASPLVDEHGRHV